uniref:hypothetical protein n=1 Tax=Segatella hominis TaxID=2518605 RepID=UPI004027F6AC
MNQKTKEKMDFWLCQHPESTHPLDENRKFSFVLELYLNHDNVQFEDLYESFRCSHPTYDEKSSRELCEKWDVEIANLKRFAEYLLDEEKV